MACCRQVPKDGLQADRQAVLAEHGIELEHFLRRGPLSPRLLACLCVLAADKPFLEEMLAQHVHPFQVINMPP